MRSFLADLNIPPLAEITLHQRERDMGKHIQKVADTSCETALQEERTQLLTKEHLEQNCNVPLRVSFDAGWSTRGSGRSYNSDTGHSVMIGSETGKCLSYSVKSKRCQICEYAEKKNVPSKTHTCYRNWSASSKAMEATMGVEMVSSLNTNKNHVKTIVMDNDSSTLAHLHAVHGDNIKNMSDKNHTKKTITDALYRLQSQHKVLKNTKVINYITKNYRYAIEQNQSNVEGLRKRLGEIVPHMYNDHSTCGQWCKHHTKNVYNQLPYKKPLSDSALKSSLETLTAQYQAKADQLAHLGSTQANESINMTIASKAPKSRYVLECNFFITILMVIIIYRYY